MMLPPSGTCAAAVLEDVEGAEDVDRERAHELIGRVVGDRRDRAADAGVAEEDVEAPVAIHPGSERRFHRVLVRDVGDRGERVLVAELADGGLELRLVDADEVDLRAFGDEQARGGEPDPALSAGDQGDLVLQSSHGHSLLFRLAYPRGSRDDPREHARVQSRSRSRGRPDAVSAWHDARPPALAG